MTKMQDDGPDGLHDVIAGDFEQGVKRRKIHPGMKKNIAVIGLVLLVAMIATGASLFFVFSNNKAMAATSEIANLGGVEEKGAANPQYKKIIDGKNIEDEAAAKQRNKSFMPVIIDKPGDVNTTVEGAGSQVLQVQSPTNSLQQASGATQQAQGQADPVKVPEVGVYTDALKVLMAQWKPQGHVNTLILETTTVAATSNMSTAATAGSVSAAVTQAVATKPANYDANLLRAFAATLDKPIRTDVAPLAIITIANGPYTGAKLKGTATRAASFMQIELTDMYFNGQHFSVKAIALDATIMSEAVIGEYNRELFDRHLLPLALDSVAAYADARSQVGSSAVSTLGGVAATIPPPTNQQAIYSGIKAGLQTAKTISAEDKAIAHVSIPANTTVAVLFLQ